MSHKNEFVFTGQVMGKRECRRKDNTVWGYEITLGQMGGKVSFNVSEADFHATTVGEELGVKGHVVQNGYNYRLEVDHVQQVNKKAA